MRKPQWQDRLFKITAALGRTADPFFKQEMKRKRK
jgi:hypothetical protein